MAASERGFDVVTCRDPGGTPLGDRLRSILQDRETVPLSMRAEMLLYMASRAQLVEDVIAPALAAGKIVISDRYLLSNIVYQGTAGGLLEEEIAMVGLSATAGLLPDLTIVLDIAPGEALARIGAPRDRIEDRPLFYHERVRAGYLAAAGGQDEPTGDGGAVSSRLPGADRHWSMRSADLRHGLQANSACGRTSPNLARLNVAWQDLRGHDRVVESLRSAIREGRLPHAMFFAGPEGIGKWSFARKLAQALLCETRPEAALDPCGECPGCLQVEAGTHPDYHEAGKPEDKHELPISVIRELCDQFALKPARGAHKVAILNDADDLNDEASNAFLKTLEEPPPGAVLILIGTSAELQKETIISRCSVVRFDPLPEAEIAALLLEKGIARDAADAARLAALGEGSVSRACGLADEELERFRRSMIDEIAAEHGFQPPELMQRIHAYIKAAGKESVNQRRRASLLIGELARFFRGVLWQTAGLAPPCPDVADRRAVEMLAHRLEPEDVLVAADRCIEADYHLARRVYLPLVLSSLMHDLGKVINPKG